MKYLLLIICLCAWGKNALSQNCPLNIDFEEGNFTNWKSFLGITYADSTGNVIELQDTTPVADRHEIMSATSAGVIPLDEYGRFPKVCPYGGKYSVKLGNSNVGAEAEGMSYTFTVPSNEDTFTITYFYAVVFENPNHEPPEQPRFFVTAYETATGNTINCASYNYVSTGGIPGFKQSDSSSDVLYKEWSPVSIQFINLENKQVTLEFKTADCTRGGHFGYAYFDVGAGCSNILATAPFCRETNSLLLNAPYGFQNYTWYSEDFSQVLGYEQNLTISPPPVTQGKFWVDLVPYKDYGCRDTAYALVAPLPVPDTPVAVTNHFFCQHETPERLSATPDLNCYLLWYTDTTKQGSYEAPLPPTGNVDSFVYYVSQKLLFGCESFRKKITVHVLPVPYVSFSINTTRQCLAGNVFITASTSTNLKSPAYEWIFGNGDTLAGPDVASYSYPAYGDFMLTLKITNDNVCSSTATTPVTAIAKPVAKFSYPNIICQNETSLAIQDNSFVPQQLSQVNAWHWNVNNTIYLSQTPPAFVPGGVADIPVSLAVATPEGCTSDTAKTFVTVHPQPRAQFIYNTRLCENEVIYFKDKSYFNTPTTDLVAAWQWNMDATAFNVQNPAHLYTGGLHHTGLTVQSNYGCNSIMADSLMQVYDRPITAVKINDSCIYRKIIYRADDMAHNVNKWYWDFGNGAKEDAAVITKYYARDGDNSFILYSETIHNCRDTVVRPFSIYMNRAKAGHDTIAAINQPVQLNANGGTDNHYTWSPSTGLNNPHIEAPIATYDRDQRYKLDAVTNEGCDAHSTIFIRRYAGPDIFIPTAFTPNRDGLNDIVKAFPVGMKQLDYFAIYNRYGERIFYTQDFSKGWDGYVHGVQAKAETFVAVAQATDYTGKKFLKKVTVVLIR